MKETITGPIEAKLEQAWQVGIKKIYAGIAQFPGGLREIAESKDGRYFEESYESMLDFYHIGCWVPSFFTGWALIAYESSDDRSLLRWANGLQGSYEKKVFEHADNTMHDLGFLYSPYCVKLYKLIGDLNHRKTALRSAEVLASRYVVKGEYLKAWGRMDENDPSSWGSGIAIIDTMMNLPLLFWATEETGNYYYRDIAIKHADMTMKRMVRPDGSVYHAYRFDSDTGQPVGGDNHCGHSVESYWARGTTWAMYGFAIAYRYTGNRLYLETAIRLSEHFISQLDDKIVPVWDFRLPEQEPDHRDSSAAAIAANAFMEILRFDPGNVLLKEWTDRLLLKLSEEAYTDYNPDCPGLLQQSNGKRMYTIYGDYFFMEALSKRLSKPLTDCW
ncbi:glycosyl hydrolase family 88 [Paenibacillus agaridevorans]|uniref:Glycosyl hydrolase family 88 n=1 Tax=Paenibacillus agaridevorans TaxID=171404 RepID=A0A2R5EWY9_9BACL|nr:glycoside hydrolase family 88 protein [Paenibacillus agaridevorans]GBG11216.1 glycosyl hydrolase family 88 [Paenibacillus agaridevorans]